MLTRSNFHRNNIEGGGAGEREKTRLGREEKKIREGSIERKWRDPLFLLLPLPLPSSGPASREKEERTEVARSRAPGCITSPNERNRMTSRDWIDKGRRRKIKGQYGQARGGTGRRRGGGGGGRGERDHPSGIKLAAGVMLARP